MALKPISTRLLEVDEFQPAIQQLRPGSLLTVHAWKADEHGPAEVTVHALVDVPAFWTKTKERWAMVGSLSATIARKVLEHQSSGGLSTTAVVTKRLPRGAEIEVWFIDDEVGLHNLEAKANRLSPPRELASSTDDGAPASDRQLAYLEMLTGTAEDEGHGEEALAFIKERFEVEHAGKHRDGADRLRISLTRREASEAIEGLKEIIAGS